jgi:tetratricopeptide (TPR) repeat protein
MMGRFFLRRASLILILFTWREFCWAQDPAEVFAAGQAALAAGDLATAEADFRRVLKDEPNSLPARANLGVVYMRRKNWTRALEEFQRAEREAPGNLGLELNIGLVYFHRGEYARAIEPFRSLVVSQPDSVQGHYLLGLCYLATEQYRQAAEELKPLWETEKQKLPYLYALALSASKAHDSAWEKRALDRLFEAGNGSAEYHLFVGRAWLMRQRDTEAGEELRKAAQINPKLPFVHYTLGVLASRQGDYALAKKEFLEDEAIEPDLLFDYEELAVIYLKLGHRHEAEQAFFHAVQLDPRAAAAYLGLAKIDNASGRYAQALANLNQAEKVNSQSASVHYLKAQALSHLHRQDEAKAEFEASARLRKSVRDRLEEQVSGHPALDAQIGFPQ